jgi:hypothetical protein
LRKQINKLKKCLWGDVTSLDQIKMPLNLKLSKWTMMIKTPRIRRSTWDKSYSAFFKRSNARWTWVNLTNKRKKTLLKEFKNKGKTPRDS